LLSLFFWILLFVFNKSLHVPCVFFLLKLFTFHVCSYTFNSCDLVLLHVVAVVNLSLRNLLCKSLYFSFFFSPHTTPENFTDGSNGCRGAITNPVLMSAAARANFLHTHKFGVMPPIQHLLDLSLAALPQFPYGNLDKWEWCHEGSDSFADMCTSYPAAVDPGVAKFLQEETLGFQPIAADMTHVPAALQQLTTLAQVEVQRVGHSRCFDRYFSAFLLFFFFNF
jgi:hypothetical protein